jgi:hypothetical protein
LQFCRLHAQKNEPTRSQLLEQASAMQNTAAHRQPNIGDKGGDAMTAIVTLLS